MMIRHPLRLLSSEIQPDTLDSTTHTQIDQFLACKVRNQTELLIRSHCVCNLSCSLQPLTFPTTSTLLPPGGDFPPPITAPSSRQKNPATARAHSPPAKPYKRALSLSPHFCSWKSPAVSPKWSRREPLDRLSTERPSFLHFPPMMVI